MTRWILTFAVVASLVACADNDLDNDGFDSEFDCDDRAFDINPDMPELCDGIDNNCDGNIDEGATTTFFADQDLDGFGDLAAPVDACELVDGLSASSLDCDDSDPDIKPGVDETCDGIDNDCDDEIDEDGIDAPTWYADVDDDGYGDAESTLVVCDNPGDGWSDVPGDCDDSLVTTYPGADEYCDGADNDCDTEIDEDDAVDAITWFADADSDTFGDPEVTTVACVVPGGFVQDNTDCDDTEVTTFPGADEFCDTIDNDCDTTIDEDDAVDAMTWFADTDSDTFGDPAVTAIACDPPTGYLADNTDCDDAEVTTYPGADEYCDTVDNDCDTTVDEDDSVDAKTWFADTDKDTYGDPDSTAVACAAPTGYIADDTDCDDTESTTYPGADEYCDGVDNDCDTTVDEDDSVDADTWFADTDKDLFGDSASTTDACSKPSGYVADDTDCDDTESTTYPGADEYCDGVDNDCDMTVDEDDAVDATTWYIDSDGDGYGDSGTSDIECSAPSGYVDNDDDCDDTSSDLNPDTKWYYDGDLDGYGASSVSYTQCLDPGTYYVRDNTDCRTSDPNSYPGAPEVCVRGTVADGIDNDCDTLVDEECPAVHCGTITADETWTDNTYGHLVTCNVYVQGSASPVLTVGAGADVRFYKNTGLWAGYSDDGDVDISGTSAKPVVFESDAATPKPGDWSGLIIHSRATGSAVSGLEISDAGGSTSWPGGIYLSNNDTPLTDVTVTNSGQHGIYLSTSESEITDSTIEDSAKTGVYCAATTCLDLTADSFDNNVITGSGDHAMRVYPASVKALATTSTYTGNTLDRVLVQGGSLTRDSTWHDLGVPYQISTPIYVQDGTYAPVLTLEDGVEMRFDTASGLWIGTSSSGDLEVKGASTGVLMTSNRPTPARGDWYGIVIGSRAGGATNIDGLDIEYGGYSTSYPANISLSSATNIEISDSTISESGRHGIYVSSGSLELIDTDVVDNDDFGLYLTQAAASSLTADVTGSTFSGNDWPIHLPAQSVHRLDSTTSYSGNTNDAIQVRYVGYLSASATWQDIGIPYYVRDNLYVGNTSSASTLTLDDGVDMRFGSNIGLWIGYSSYNGDLIVNGDRTLGKGVTFDSYSGSGPGTWYGIIIGQNTSTATDLAGFELRDAGYSTSFQGGIHVQYGTVALSDCLIEDNERWGVYMQGSSSSTHSTVEISDCILQTTETSNTSSLPDGDGLGMNNNQWNQLSLDEVTFTGNDRYPLTVHANAVDAIESSSTGSYTGNGTDKVLVYGGWVTGDVTWQYPGVPYLIADHIYIRNTSTSPAKVNTSGTTFEFGIGKGLVVGQSNYGDLVASGATFTSSRPSPLAGDWCGVQFGYYSSSASKLSTSTVEYGGKGTGCPGSAALAAGVSTYYSPASITGNTVTDSDGEGVHIYYSTSATVTGNTLNDNANYGLRCQSSTGATVSGNSFSGNGSGSSSGC